MSESGPVVVPADAVINGAGATIFGSLSGLPTIGIAGTALAAGGTFLLQNASSAYIGLWNGTAYQGALVQVTGSSGNLPTLTPVSAGGYQVRLCSDSAGAAVLASSPTSGSMA